MMQVTLLVRRDCQYLHRVNQAAPREALTLHLRREIEAVMCGENDMMPCAFENVMSES